MEGDPALDPDAPEIGAEGFPRAHGRLNDCARTCPPRMSRRDGVSLAKPGTYPTSDGRGPWAARSVFLQPITVFARASEEKGDGSPYPLPSPVRAPVPRSPWSDAL